MTAWTARVRMACGVGLAVAATIAATAASASAFGLRPAAGPPSGYDVTLVTGDRVHVTPVAGGRHTATVTPAPGGPRPSYWVHQSGDDLYVIPGDVAALVPRRLDPALFNVTALAEQGYADEPLPLIVTYRGGAPAAPPGTTRVRTLESIRGLAVQAPAARAPQLGRAMDRFAAGPLAGVEKIWLDPVVHAQLDESVPQIGAPEVWQAGFDGTGIDVAVLDTGIDAEHPDLAGAVTAARNFSFDPDEKDRNGHGTHVASIIASHATGLRGVAPGAHLLSGKVLDADGSGFASSVIDGMEWASTEQHADVVNMSLGVPSDTFDAKPLAEALDRLSAANGTLFVVAAGNDACEGCVRSPGTAERALTVGAVDDDDVLADFSNRGPVGDDFALKPDVTAPGVGIAAARAAGTSLGDPIDELHTRLSGTSMATPHVAGAAALLLDARSDMTAGQLKAALMSTAVPSLAGSVYAQGAGRIDVARAYASSVVSETASLGYGHFRYPHDAREPVMRPVTYRNRSAAPVTLELEATATDKDGKPAAAGTVSVDAPRVTVPPGGTAEAGVIVDTRRPAAGLYGGQLLARMPDGTVLRTPLGFDIEPEKYDLHVTGIARDGRPAFGGFTVLDVEDGNRINAARFLGGEPGPCTSDASDVGSCVRVPPGTYSVLGAIQTMPARVPSTEYNRPVLNTALVGSPEVRISRDTEYTLDARRAKPVTIDVPEREAKANLGGALELVWHRAPERGPGIVDYVLQSPGTQEEEKFFMQPSSRVARGEFAALTRWRLEEPAIDLDVQGRPDVELDPSYYDPVWHSDVSSQYPLLDGTRKLRVVHAGTATAAEIARLDLRGKLAVVRRSNAVSVPAQAANAHAAGAVMIAVYNDGPGSNADPGEVNVRLALPSVRLSGEEGAALLRRLAQDRHLRLRAEGIPASRYRYDLVLLEHDRVRSDPHFDLRSRDLARVDLRYHGHLDQDMTYSESSYAWQPWEEASFSVNEPVLGAPRVQRNYLSTSPGTRWAHGVSTPEEPYNFIWPQPELAHVRLDTAAATEYGPGERRTLSWLEQPVAPGLNPLQPLQRRGDLMRVSMSAFVDSAGNHARAYTSPFENGFVTDFRMYEDDALIAQTDSTPVGTVAVAEGPARYRIEYDVDNHAPWARLSTDTQTVWTFSSRRPAGDEIVTPALLTVDWDADVDLRNRLEGRRLEVKLGHQPGAPAVPPRSVTLDVSYDDGASWRSVGHLRRIGTDRWEAELDRHPPRGSGFVSLRLRGSDVAGNGIDQRIMRAYALSRR